MNDIFVHTDITHSSDFAFDEDEIFDDDNQSSPPFASKQRISESQEEGREVGEELHMMQPQPAFITTRVNDKEVVRTNDIRVSERTPLIELRLKSFEPIYNELTGEVS